MSWWQACRDMERLKWSKVGGYDDVSERWDKQKGLDDDGECTDEYLELFQKKVEM